MSRDLCRKIVVQKKNRDGFFHLLACLRLVSRLTVESITNHVEKKRADRASTRETAKNGGG